MDWNLAKSVQCMRRRLGCVVKTSASIIAIAMAGTAWGAPLNDEMNNAYEITSVRGRSTGFTTDATSQPDEPLPKFVPSATNTVWYVWIMPEDGMAWVATEYPSIDTVMGVYRLSGSSIVKVAENDDIGAGLRTSRCKFKATAGTHYYIAVSGKGNDGQGSFWLDWILTPVNDNFEDAIVSYKTKSDQVSGSTVRATAQTGEPLPKFVPAATNTLWWAWTAPDAGYVAFDTMGSGFDTVMGIYTGTSVSSLTVVRENDDEGDQTSLCKFYAAKDTKYYIAVSGYGNSQGTVRLKWLLRPANDEFDHATPISGGSGSVQGSTKDATFVSGEPLLSVQHYATNTVWWVWTAPETSEVVFHTTNTTFDTVMGVYTGTSVSSLAKVVEDDDSGPARTSICRFDAVRGTTYYIAVSGYGNSNQGTVRLEWSFKPRNDNFANAVACIGNPVYAYAMTIGATVESGEPLPKRWPSATNTVWWSWIAPDDGTATFHTTNSTFDTVMGIYTGTSVSSLTTVVEDDDSGPHYTSLCNFTASKGTKYYIAVSGRDGESGTAKLAWQFVALADRFKVTFGKNGGTGGSDYVTAVKGEAMPAATAPTKSGYVFEGYWTTTGAGGVQYYDGAMKSVRNWDKTANTTLWAKWTKAVSVKVTLSKNGGTGGDNYVTATYGSAMPTPRTAPTLSGYTFAGYWDSVALDENGNPKGKQYYDGNMKSARNWDKTSAATLWAKWTNKVTFGKNGGTGGDNDVTAIKGQPMPKRTMPTKSGYFFDGYWDTTGAGGVKYYNSDGTSAHAWDKSGNVTLWAKWVKPVACKVTFGKNGGTGGDAYVTATSGQPMPTPRTAPTLSGWTFAGYWDTLAQDANGNPTGKQYYDSNMKSVRAWDKTTDATLWAKWTVKVTLGKNGGTGGDNVVTVTKGQAFPKRAMPTKAGYTFGGYFVSASSKTGQCYNPDGTGTSSMKWSSGGTPTIWALWTKTSSCVEVAQPAAVPAFDAPAAAEPAEIPAGLYSGVLADGKGTFCLLLDEAEGGVGRTAYLYVACEGGVFTAECTAEEVGWALLLTTADGVIYAFDPVACTLVPVN